MFSIVYLIFRVKMVFTKIVFVTLFKQFRIFFFIKMFKQKLSLEKSLKRKIEICVSIYNIFNGDLALLDNATDFLIIIK